jgi:hypothetical protein
MAVLRSENGVISEDPRLVYRLKDSSQYLSACSKYTTVYSSSATSQRKRAQNHVLRGYDAVQLGIALVRSMHACMQANNLNHERMLARMQV